LPTTNFLKTGNNTFTWEFWFNTTKSDANYHRMVYLGYAGFGAGYAQIYMTADEEIGFNFQDTGSDNVSGASSTGPYNDGAWHHCVLAFNGSAGNAKLYIDTVLVADSTNAAINTALYPTQKKMLLGAQYYHSSTYRYDYTGKIGLFANYDHTLTVNEIRKNYVKGRAYIAWLEVKSFLTNLTNYYA